MSKHASKGKLVDLKINSKHHIKFPINTEYVWELGLVELMEIPVDC